MAEILGTGLTVPTINVSGFISSSWIYVFVVAIIGFFFIAIISIILFYNTYKIKVIFKENVSGTGFQNIAKRRARIIKVGDSGEVVLKPIGVEALTAYGRKTGRNEYTFAKGQDGYWYNVIYGDLDAKRSILDIDPVDKDVRMFHAAKSRMNKEDYLKADKFSKWVMPILMLIMVIILVVGFYIIAGKITEGMNSISAASKTNLETAQLTKDIAVALQNIKAGGSGSGIVPVGEG